jgi:radical SAM superfamily enzyme YgiQ (UPF0313 family)
MRREAASKRIQKMHIVLVDPGSAREEINEPIGIGMIAAAVELELGTEAHVSQYFEPINGLPDQQQVREADVLGISTPLGSMEKLRALVTQWRAIPSDERPVLTLGGVIATFAPDSLLTEFPEAIVVIGEGEEAFSLLVKLILKNSRGLWRQVLAEASIPNLKFNTPRGIVNTHRQNIDLAKYPCPTRPFLKQLISLGGIVRAESSRGCSYGHCTFCAIQHKYSNKIEWRTVGIPRVIQELCELSASGVRHPYFTDEDFVGADPTRALALADAIKREKELGNIANDLTLYVDMRVASILAGETAHHPSGLSVLRSLQEAGLREVFVGIESGSGEQAKRYRKPATTERNLRALQLLRGVGISTDIGFIFFDPEMTLQEAEANLAFLRSADLWYHDARLTKEVRLEAGTPLVDIYNRKNLIAGPLDVDQLTFPYRWRCSQVESIHEVFRTWEAIEQELVYKLQAATRGEVSTLTQRQERRTALGKIRAVELDALESLVVSTKQGNDPALHDLSTFSRRRRDLLTQSQEIFV